MSRLKYFHFTMHNIQAKIKIFGNQILAQNQNIIAVKSESEYNLSNANVKITTDRSMSVKNLGKILTRKYFGKIKTFVSIKCKRHKLVVFIFKARYNVTMKSVHLVPFEYLFQNLLLLLFCSCRRFTFVTCLQSVIAI